MSNTTKSLQSAGVQSLIKLKRNQSIGSGNAEVFPSNEKEVMDMWTKDRDEMVKKRK